MGTFFFFWNAFCSFFFHFVISLMPIRFRKPCVHTFVFIFLTPCFPLPQIRPFYAMQEAKWNALLQPKA